MKIDNSERKGVLENSSSLFPIRKRLWFIPSLLQIFASSTNCSGPRSGSGSRNLPAQQSPSACAPVLLKSTRSTQMLQGDLKLSSLPRAGVSQPAGGGCEAPPTRRGPAPQGGPGGAACSFLSCASSWDSDSRSWEKGGGNDGEGGVATPPAPNHALRAATPLSWPRPHLKALPPP